MDRRQLRLVQCLGWGWYDNTHNSRNISRCFDVPDMTPDEFQRRIDAADALWLELVRAATSKDRS
jgi:hypothetical protein